MFSLADGDVTMNYPYPTTSICLSVKEKKIATRGEIQRQLEAVMKSIHSRRWGDWYFESRVFIEN
jgi:hypothetical protein